MRASRCIYIYIYKYIYTFVEVLLPGGLKTAAAAAVKPGQVFFIGPVRRALLRAFLAASFRPR